LRRFLRAALLIVALVIVGAELYLLLSGKRFLVREDMTTPGRPYLVAGYGDLGQMTDPKLACTYFNGRRLLTRAYHYSPANFLGRAACPVWLDERE
jgi:hypothetical protein